MEAGSLHVQGKGIVVAKMVSEHGSRWLRAKVLKKACREGKPGEARIPPVNNSPSFCLPGSLPHPRFACL